MTVDRVSNNIYILLLIMHGTNMKIIISTLPKYNGSVLLSISLTEIHYNLLRLSCQIGK